MTSCGPLLPLKAPDPVIQNPPPSPRAGLVLSRAAPQTASPKGRPRAPFPQPDRPARTSVSAQARLALRLRLRLRPVPLHRTSRRELVPPPPIPAGLPGSPCAALKVKPAPWRRPEGEHSFRPAGCLKGARLRGPHSRPGRGEGA